MDFCDYIAKLIKENLIPADDSQLIFQVGRIEWDLSPEGYLNSTKKEIEVVDINSKKYKITIKVEE